MPGAVVSPEGPCALPVAPPAPAAASETAWQPWREPQETTSDAVNPGHASGHRPHGQDPAIRASADEDADLVQAFACGDARAFDALYRKHRAWLYRVILRQLGRAERSQVVFQEVWLAATRLAPDWNRETSFSAWLYGLARARIVDDWQPDAAALPAGPAVPASPPAAATFPAAEGILQALAALPPLQREAYLLAVDAQLSLAEAAQTTGTTLDGARARLASARSSLADALADALSKPLAAAPVSDTSPAAATRS